MTTENKRLIVIIAAVPLLLLIPLVAMQFTSEVDWDPRDFVIIGTLLLVTGFACELVLRKIKSWKGRLVLCAIILGVFLLIWGELATGYFRSKITGVPPSEITNKQSTIND